MTVGQVFPDQYQQLLDDKVAVTTQLFDALAEPVPTPEVFASEPSHYRMRAEFRVWHQDDDSYFIMFDPATRDKIRMDQFPVGTQKINELMTALRTAVLANPVLRLKLYQVEFLTTQLGQVLITLIYHRKLDEAWENAAKDLEQALNVFIIGRSRKQRVVVSQTYVQEAFDVAGKTFQYRQYENGFTQPNAGLCQQMLNWAVKQAEPFTGDLVELYCGNGNFTLPLAQQFNQVLATEVSKTSIKAANENAQLNQVTNVQFEKASSEDFSAAWLAPKDASHNKLRARMNLDDYQFTTLFVDPPRAGLDDDTVQLASHFDQILYISCNPETLAANVKALESTHKVSAFAMFDQFPYTHHMECGMVLEKRS